MNQQYDNKQPQNLIEYHEMVWKCRDLIGRLGSNGGNVSFELLVELNMLISKLALCDLRNMPRGKLSKYPEFREIDNLVKANKLLGDYKRKQRRYF